MRSKAKNTSLKSKPVALKLGKAFSMRSQSKKMSMKSKPVTFKQRKASESKSAGPLAS